MLLKLYAIRDTKAEAFNTPIAQLTHAEAERTFNRLMSDSQTMMGLFPEDFDLYYLGTYDTTDGKLKPLSAPEHIISGALIKKNAPTTVNAGTQPLQQQVTQ